MRVTDLFYFDKNGVNLNLTGTDGVLHGSMFLEAVSRNLYSTEKIIVVEKKADGTFGYPDLSYGERLEFVFEDTSEATLINLFTFDAFGCPNEDTSALTYEEYNCPELRKSDSAVIEAGDAIDSYAQINICFCNENDNYDTFMRTLSIKHTDISGVTETIAKIDIFCESVPEDTRLKAVAGNLGYDLFEKDCSIFRDTDIKEPIPDYKFLNDKRKEIILEGHNIYPYIGSYRGLLNVLKYFGYSDITIREWWKNIDPGTADYMKHILASKYSLSGPEKVESFSGTKMSLPNKSYKKTNRIALCWDINRLDTGNYIKTSQFTLPPQIEVYAFTIEEVLIKLYNLKRKLEDEFLPVNVNIKDIIGEICGVTGLAVSHHAKTDMISYVETGNRCGFTLDTNFAYIEDLRPFMTFPLGGVIPTGAVTLEDIQSLGLSLFNTDYNTYPAPVSGNMITGADGFTMAETDETDVTDSDIEQECVDTTGHFDGGVPISVDSSDFGGLYAVNNPKNGISCYRWEFYKADNNGADNIFLAHYSRYSPKLRFNAVRANSLRAVSNCLPDDKNAVCGALVRLICDCGDATWQSASDFSWDLLDNATWETCKAYINNISRVQWTVVGADENNSDVKIEITGEILKGYGDIAVVLPKTGSYSINMRSWDWFNNMSDCYKTRCVEVLPKNVEISGWYESLSPKATIDSLGSATYDSLDRAEYATLYAYPQDPMSSMAVRRSDGEILTDGAFLYDNIDARWNDMQDKCWDFLMLTSDFPGHIIINGFTNGSRNGLAGMMLEIITKDERHFAIELAFDDINSLAEQLNGLYNEPGVIGEVMSKFEFQKYSVSPVQGKEPQLVGISKNPDSDKLIKEVRICNLTEVAIDIDGTVVYDESINYGGQYIPYEFRNPKWDTVETLLTFKEIPRYTSVILDYTKTKIVSKQNPKWEIVSDNGFSLQSDKEIVHYVFTEPGCYTANLELEDRNGNTYKGTKRIFLIK